MRQIDDITAMAAKKTGPRQKRVNFADRQRAKKIAAPVE
jgi:hypothetical protein